MWTRCLSLQLRSPAATRTLHSSSTSKVSFFAWLQLLLVWHPWVRSICVASDADIQQVDYLCGTRTLKHVHKTLTQISVRKQTEKCVSVILAALNVCFCLPVGLCFPSLTNNLFSYRFINVTIEFQLKAINIQTIINNEIPDCYTFYIRVSNKVKDVNMSWWQVY